MAKNEITRSLIASTPIHCFKIKSKFMKTFRTQIIASTKTLFLMTAGIMLLSSCGGSDSDNETSNNGTDPDKEVPPVEAVSNDPMDNKGVGQITSIDLGDVDDALATEGKAQFDLNCTACHKIGKRYIGPDLMGITDRRSPEWIMNMILDPEKMVAEDPIAKGLLGEFVSPMANQNLTVDQSRAILEYFRTLEPEPES